MSRRMMYFTSPDSNICCRRRHLGPAPNAQTRGPKPAMNSVQLSPRCVITVSSYSVRYSVRYDARYVKRPSNFPADPDQGMSRVQVHPGNHHLDVRHLHLHPERLELEVVVPDAPAALRAPRDLAG